MYDTTWMDTARCRQLDPDMFFPNDGAGVIRAARICAKCPVSEQCLEYALSEQIDDGVWGGVSARERRRIIRTRRRSVAHGRID